MRCVGLAVLMVVSTINGWPTEEDHEALKPTSDLASSVGPTGGLQRTAQSDSYGDLEYLNNGNEYLDSSQFYAQKEAKAHQRQKSENFKNTRFVSDNRGLNAQQASYRSREALNKDFERTQSFNEDRIQVPSGGYRRNIQLDQSQRSVDRRRYLEKQSSELRVDGDRSGFQSSKKGREDYSQLRSEDQFLRHDVDSAFRDSNAAIKSSLDLESAQRRTYNSEGSEAIDQQAFVHSDVINGGYQVPKYFENKRTRPVVYYNQNPNGPASAYQRPKTFANPLLRGGEKQNFGNEFTENDPENYVRESNRIKVFRNNDGFIKKGPIISLQNNQAKEFERNTKEYINKALKKADEAKKYANIIANKLSAFTNSIEKDLHDVNVVQFADNSQNFDNANDKGDRVKVVEFADNSNSENLGNAEKVQVVDYATETGYHNGAPVFQRPTYYLPHGKFVNNPRYKDFYPSVVTKPNYGPFLDYPVHVRKGYIPYRIGGSVNVVENADNTQNFANPNNKDDDKLKVVETADNSQSVTNVNHENVDKVKVVENAVNSNDQDKVKVVEFAENQDDGEKVKIVNNSNTNDESNNGVNFVDSSANNPSTQGLVYQRPKTFANPLLRGSEKQKFGNGFIENDPENDVRDSKRIKVFRNKGDESNNGNNGVNVVDSSADNPSIQSSWNQGHDNSHLLRYSPQSNEPVFHRPYYLPDGKFVNNPRYKDLFTSVATKPNFSPNVNYPVPIREVIPQIVNTDVDDGAPGYMTSPSNLNQDSEFFDAAHNAYSKTNLRHGPIISNSYYRNSPNFLANPAVNGPTTIVGRPVTGIQVPDISPVFADVIALPDGTYVPSKGYNADLLTTDKNSPDKEGIVKPVEEKPLQDSSSLDNTKLTGVIDDGKQPSNPVTDFQLPSSETSLRHGPIISNSYNINSPNIPANQAVNAPSSTVGGPTVIQVPDISPVFADVIALPDGTYVSSKGYNANLSTTDDNAPDSEGIVKPVEEKPLQDSSSPDETAPENNRPTGNDVLNKVGPTTIIGDSPTATDFQLPSSQNNLRHGPIISNSYYSNSPNVLANQAVNAPTSTVGGPVIQVPDISPVFADVIVLPDGTYVFSKGYNADLLKTDDNAPDKEGIVKQAVNAPTSIVGRPVTGIQVPDISPVFADVIVLPDGTYVPSKGYNDDLLTTDDNAPDKEGIVKQAVSAPTSIVGGPVTGIQVPDISPVFADVIALPDGTYVPSKGYNDDLLTTDDNAPDKEGIVKQAVNAPTSIVGGPVTGIQVPDISPVFADVIALPDGTYVPSKGYNADLLTADENAPDKEGIVKPVEDKPLQESSSPDNTKLTGVTDDGKQPSNPTTDSELPSSKIGLRHGPIISNSLPTRDNTAEGKTKRKHKKNKSRKHKNKDTSTTDTVNDISNNPGIVNILNAGKKDEIKNVDISSQDIKASETTLLDENGDKKLSTKTDQVQLKKAKRIRKKRDKRTKVASDVDNADKIEPTKPNTETAETETDKSSKVNVIEDGIVSEDLKSVSGESELSDKEKSFQDERYKSKHSKAFKVRKTKTKHAKRNNFLNREDIKKDIESQEGEEVPKNNKTSRKHGKRSKSEKSTKRRHKKDKKSKKHKKNQNIDVTVENDQEETKTIINYQESSNKQQDKTTNTLEDTVAKSSASNPKEGTTIDVKDETEIGTDITENSSVATNDDEKDNSKNNDESVNKENKKQKPSKLSIIITIANKTSKGKSKLNAKETIGDENTDDMKDNVKDEKLNPTKVNENENNLPQTQIIRKRIRYYRLPLHKRRTIQKTAQSTVEKQEKSDDSSKTKETKEKSNEEESSSNSASSSANEINDTSISEIEESNRTNGKTKSKKSKVTKHSKRQKQHKVEIDENIAENTEQTYKEDTNTSEKSENSKTSKNSKRKREHSKVKIDKKIAENTELTYNEDTSVSENSQSGIEQVVDKSSQTTDTTKAKVLKVKSKIRKEIENKVHKSSEKSKTNEQNIIISSNSESVEISNESDSVDVNCKDENESDYLE